MNYTKHFECGCEIHAVLEGKIIIGSDIHQCPLHKAAPALVEAVRWVLEDYREDNYTRLKVSTHTQLLNALTKAEK